MGLPTPHRRLILLASVLLALLSISCDSGSAFSQFGQTGIYGSVDLNRLTSDKPPPSSHEENERYYDGGLGP